MMVCCEHCVFTFRLDCVKNVCVSVCIVYWWCVRVWFW